MFAANPLTRQTRAQQIRVIAAASIGNALEWYDFVVYGFFATILAPLFFPAKDTTTSLLVAFATFGITFLVRPIGAIILGAYADRRGRKSAFTLTIVLMTISTAMIAFAPTYASIGMGAPLIIVFARIIQGLSAGGEFGSATALLAEQNPSKRGYFASWQFASQGVTAVLATGVGVLLFAFVSKAQVVEWGWRLPFFVGLLIGPVAFYIRKRVDEPFEFLSANRNGKSPVVEAFSECKIRMLTSFGLVVLCTVGMYTILFMPAYATRQLGLQSSGAYAAGFLAGTIQLIVIPLAGLLSDRIGRISLAAISASALLIAIYPLFNWLVISPALETLLTVEGILGLLLAGYMGGLAALMVELFPTRMRTTGLSISYSLGVAIFGGFAPFINAWLISLTHDKLAPSFYLMLSAAISLVALAAARRLATCK